jgi:ribonuclease HI
MVRCANWGGRDQSTTNNRMEMTATIRALELIQQSTADKILLYTDSTYVIRGITQWVHGWRARGWKNSEGKDVANRDLWEDLMRQVTRLKPLNIDWKYVRGHSGFDGNERCDEIAVAFSKGLAIDLYCGSSSSYLVNLDSLPAEQDLPDQKKSGASQSTESSNGSKAKPSGNGSLSYLSYLSGVVMRHSTWSACERRVKGHPAKFKKAKSRQEEQQILSSWGLSTGTTIVED